MNKTEDIEVAIVDHLADGPATFEQLMGWLGWVGDGRWIGVALMHLRRDGRIRYTSCDADHNHDGSCVVEATR